VVFLDAVGTLLHADPPAPEAYVRVGRRHGSRLDPATVAARFWRAFGRQEEQDRARGLRTDEAHEVRRWRAIVGEVLDDVDDPEACFRELHEHFARPSAWACPAGTAEALAALEAAGLRLGVASNFDGRLRTVAAGLEALRPVRRLVISSEVGWRKPAAPFFAEVCRQAAVPPGQVLFVGDDLANDYQGARAAGLQALLLDPRGRCPVPASDRVASPDELVRYLGAGGPLSAR
jgi:putative hydrolase of the HAD superfamily